MAAVLAIMRYGRGTRARSTPQYGEGAAPEYPARDEHWASRAGLVAVVTIAAACLMKSVGLALVPAAAAWLLIDAGGGRAQNVKKAALLAAAVAVLWLAANYSILGNLAYVRELDERALRPHGAPLGASAVAARTLDNLVRYLKVGAETVVYACYERSWPVLEIGVLAIVAVGLAWSLARHRSVLEYYALVCGGLVLAYQPSNVGNRQRYLVTLVPFALYYFWRGLRGLRLPRRAALAVLAVLLALNGVATVRSSVLHTQPEMFDYYRFDRWAELRRMASWMRDHTPPETVVMTTHPHQVHFWSRRRVVRYVRAPDTLSDQGVLDAIAAAGASHVAVSPFSSRWSEEIRLAETVAARPDAFERVYEDGPELIFRRRIGPQPPSQRPPGD
jgi:hypothetical protein